MSPNGDENSRENDLLIPIVAGVGGCVLLSAIVLGVCCVVRRRRNSASSSVDYDAAEFTRNDKGPVQYSDGIALTEVNGSAGSITAFSTQVCLFFKVFFSFFFSKKRFQTFPKPNIGSR